MPPSDLTSITMQEARARLKAGQVSSVELTQAHLDRIAALDGHVHAYLAVTPERALKQARAADARRAQGEDGPLLGLPLATKDPVPGACREGHHPVQSDLDATYEDIRQEHTAAQEHEPRPDVLGRLGFGQVPPKGIRLDDLFDRRGVGEV